MQRNRWMVGLLIFTALPLSACAEKSETTGRSEPAKVEPLENTELKLLVLTPRAAERLGIETVAVRDALVYRKRIVGGEVVAAPAASDMVAARDSATTPRKAGEPRKVWVQVALNQSDLSKVDRRKPARILRQAGGVGAAGLRARAVGVPANGRREYLAGALYYAIDGAGHGLVPGRRVLVELSLTGSGTRRKIVPYSAVIYGVHGETWVYTNPKPLVFVRHLLDVDYIDGDLAILSEGPASGTEVVTVGVAELFGTELGVGGH